MVDQVYRVFDVFCRADYGLNFTFCFGLYRVYRDNIKWVRHSNYYMLTIAFYADKTRTLRYSLRYLSRNIGLYLSRIIKAHILKAQVLGQ